MAGMYDPFAHLPNRNLTWAARKIETDYYMCLGAIELQMEDPALHDDWPEWSVDW